MVDNKREIIEEAMSFELDENGLPKLCEKNFIIIETLIKNDSNYRKPDIRKENYEMILQDGIPSNLDDVILVVKLIDKQNSTHLSSEGQGYSKEYKANKGIEITARKIFSMINSGELETKLKAGDSAVVHEIANAVNEYHGK